MPDLTWDDKPFSRNALGISTTSELWMDGEVVSKAELIRNKRPVIPMDQQAALEAAAADRGAMDFDPGHWYWQPVGGRMGNLADKPQQLEDKTLRKGFTGAQLL